MILAQPGMYAWLIGKAQGKDSNLFIYRPSISFSLHYKICSATVRTLAYNLTQDRWLHWNIERGKRNEEKNIRERDRERETDKDRQIYRTERN